MLDFEESYRYAVDAIYTEGLSERTISLVLKADSTIGVGIAEIAEISSVLLYPNPADAQVNLRVVLSSDQQTNLDLLNNLGQSMGFQQRANGSRIEASFDVSNLANGIYWLSLQFGENRYLKQVLVRH